MLVVAAFLVRAREVHIAAALCRTAGVAARFERGGGAVVSGRVAMGMLVARLTPRRRRCVPC